MKKYSILEQLNILLNCNTASDLLEIKELLIEVSSFSNTANILYNRLMSAFLQLNKIK